MTGHSAHMPMRVRAESTESAGLEVWLAGGLESAQMRSPSWIYLVAGPSPKAWGVVLCARVRCGSGYCRGGFAAVSALVGYGRLGQTRAGTAQ